MDCKVNARLSLLRVQPVLTWVDGGIKGGEGRTMRRPVVAASEHFPYKTVLYWLGWRDFWKCFSVKIDIRSRLSGSAQFWDSAAYWRTFLKLKKRKDKLYIMFFGVVWHVYLWTLMWRKFLLFFMTAVLRPFFGQVMSESAIFTFTLYLYTSS